MNAQGCCIAQNPRGRSAIFCHDFNATQPQPQHHTPWPYPRWIAHRGAGTLAPENTLAAFRLGAQHGYRMFECDAKLSADGVLFVLHDATLERTTNGHGSAALQSMGALAQLDAGSWHSHHYAGEPIPTLQALARYCIAHHYMLNVEIKPNPGQAWATGHAVGHLMAQCWASAPDTQTPPPLLTSFEPEALEGARAAAAHIPRGLLVDAWGEPYDAADCVLHALHLGCQALVLEHTLWDAPVVQHTTCAGLHCMTYTVNDAHTAQRLMALGIEGIITDRVDFFNPAA